MSDRREEYVHQPPTIFTQGLFSESSTQKQRIGTVRCLEDGRTFIYSRAGAVALAAGKLTQAAVGIANHLNESVAAAVAVGEKSVTVTLGATAATLNQYAGGYLLINDAAGEGYAYKIRSHPAADASASLVVTLYDAVRVALTTASEGTLSKNSNDGVLVFPTTQTGVPAGVPTIAVTASYYFWNQVRGACSVLTDTTTVVGNVVIPSTNIAGAVMPGGTNDVVGAIARCVAVQADTEYGLFNLNILGY